MKKIISNCLIMFISLFIILYVYSIEYFSANYKYYKTGNDSDISICILLTSCIRGSDKDKKLEYYKKSIKNWLDNTTLPIFIVESSNYTFPEFKDTRLKVCSFNLEGLSSSTQYESQSILYAMDYFKEDMKPYTHILKVTARYYLPNIENILKNIPNVDLIYQYSYKRLYLYLYSCPIVWQNSEIFGFKKELATDIFTPTSFANSLLMEEHIATIIKKYTYTRLPSIDNIFKVERGGDKIILKSL